MRKAMQQAVRSAIQEDSNTALLLVDIGAWPFHDLLETYPERAKNIGIFESGTVSLAAGLSLSGITPIVYGISPFIVQRSLEQLKLDFVYQKIGGNFISTGAAYDFSTLGYSHYCPEDVATLYQLPGMDILTPGTAQQFRTLWDACVRNGRPSYFRMTDYSNTASPDVEYGKATVLKQGRRGVLITAAETLDAVLSACDDMDVTILYYTTLQPFDAETLRREVARSTSNIFVCEPFYKGTMTPMIIDAMDGVSIRLSGIGVPRKVLRTYGTKEEKDVLLGLTSENIRAQAESFFIRKDGQI